MMVMIPIVLTSLMTWWYWWCDDYCDGDDGDAEDGDMIMMVMPSHSGGTSSFDANRSPGIRYRQVHLPLAPPPPPTHPSQITCLPMLNMLFVLVPSPRVHGTPHPPTPTPNIARFSLPVITRLLSLPVLLLRPGVQASIVPSPLLQHVNFVDTPGMVSPGKHGSVRGFPFPEVTPPPPLCMCSFCFLEFVL